MIGSRLSSHPDARRRAGITLIELAVSVAVTALIAVVLGGLVTATRTARDHAHGLHEATAQGRRAIGRMRDAVGRAGVYQVAGGATVPGVAVVTTAAGASRLPETLVVWTGGRTASLADAGVLARLPLANELVIVRPSPTDPSRLVEIAVPTATGSVDFADPAALAMKVGQLVASPNAVAVTLCDRVRVGRSEIGSAAAAVRFEWEPLPSDADLAALVAGTKSPAALPWVVGSYSPAGGGGLRQLALRVELQVRTTDVARPGGDDPSLPVFGSIVRRYDYRRTGP